MKKYLLDPKSVGYRANLHCHSTVSDGYYSPEEIKRIYRERGYSIVAFTDHNVMPDHSDLTDSEFLALNGFEAEFNEPYGEGTGRNFYDIKTAHIVFISLDPDNLTQPFWHRTKYQDNGNVKKNVPFIKYREDEPDFERSHTPECINRAIALGRERGFFVSYSHPAWTLEDYTDYTAYEGLCAMEIFNNSSSCQGYEEYSPRVYDDMLRAGRRLSCIATDDNHNTHDKAYDPFPECFGGFTMIHASALEYRAVADALAKGQCYASSAPLIKELYYEDGRICIETSPARTIDFTTDRRHSKRVYTRDGSLVTKGEFELDERDSWVRVTVTDAEGRHANTRAYFRDELEEDA